MINFNTSKKILVTGGTGFVGSHTIVELLDRNFAVVTIDNLANSSSAVIDRIRQIQGGDLEFLKVDVCNSEALEEVFTTYEFSAVLHFAGLKAVGESTTDPLGYFWNNISGSINLLKTMERHNVTNFIFSSSATVYDSTKTKPPFNEDSPLGAINPYGHSKLEVENICRQLCTYRPDWQIALLRYFNPVGAHPSGLIGESPTGIPNNLLPFCMQVAAGQRPHLTVFGDDYETPDGTCIRDYIHVVDVAKAHVAALDYILNCASSLKPSRCEAINIGTGQGFSVLNVIETLNTIIDTPLPYKIGPRRLGDSAISFAGTDKAKDLLKWSAKASLAEMCRDAYRWQKLSS
jgi:UDP-glucose 4-epimerase